MLRVVLHIGQNVLLATFRHIGMAFRSLRLCCQGLLPSPFELFRLKVGISCWDRAMIYAMVAISHILEIFRPIVGRSKVLVMDDRFLAFKFRHFAQQATSGDHPMYTLVPSRVGL